MRQVLYGFGIMLVGISAASALELEGDAFKLARDSGTVIGAATACGLASDRAAVVWQRIRVAGTTGPGAASERDFAVVHAEAVRTAGVQQQRAGRKGCDRAIAAFKQLEDTATLNR